jgi:hypothetical protein
MRSTGVEFFRKMAIKPRAGNVTHQYARPTEGLEMLGTSNPLAVLKLLPLLAAASVLAACNQVSPTVASSATTSGSSATSGGGTTTTGGGTTGTATLTWVAPVQNTNGSTLTDLSGYTIYYGTDGSSLTETIQITDPTQSTYVINNLSTGTYYFSVSANASNGTQSSRSTVASKTIM